MIILLALGFTLPEPPTEGSAGHAPYCGIYCVYSLASHFHRSIRFEDLATPKFVTMMRGSSSDDLLAALGTVNLHGKSLADVRLSQLLSYRHPTILHVRTPGTAVIYRHWVVFQGINPSGQYLLYDPPRGAYSLSEAELLAIWDGKAIVVYEPDEAVPRDWLPLHWLATMVVALALVAALNRTGRWLAVPLAAGLMSLGASWLEESSFWRNPHAVGIVNAAHFQLEAADVEYADFNKHDRIALIDARAPEAFEQGHLPGAYNLPVTSGYGTLKAAMAIIPRESTVVCYCQNDRCAWSDHIANQFLHRGYRRVLIYREGYSGWLAAQIKPPADSR